MDSLLVGAATVAPCGFWSPWTKWIFLLLSSFFLVGFEEEATTHKSVEVSAIDSIYYAKIKSIRQQQQRLQQAGAGRRAERRCRPPKHSAYIIWTLDYAMCKYAYIHTYRIHAHIYARCCIICAEIILVLVCTRFFGT